MTETKLIKIAKRINPFGGIYFVINKVQKLGLSKLFDSQIPERAKQSKYSFSDVILGWCYSTLCGAKRLEDTKWLKEHFADINGTKLPSPDRIAHIIKQLSVPTEKVYYKSGITLPSLNDLNTNARLNDLLLKTAKKLGTLKSGIQYTLDYDTVVIENRKYDSKNTYNKKVGYNPAVAFIRNTPVFVQGRSGNTHPSFALKNTLIKVFENLENNGIKIDRFRCDAAGYNVEVMDYLDEKKIEFFIRGRISESIFSNTEDLKWKKVKLKEYTTMEICSALYTPHRSRKTYRVVMTRTPFYFGSQKDIKGGKYMTRAIITNCDTLSDEEVLHFYNQRGDIENNFANLKNDFNWSRLPFSFLNENTAFMILASISYIIYRHLLVSFSKKLKFVYPTMELKSFIFHFISVALQMANKKAFLYTEKGYEVLLE